LRMAMADRGFGAVAAAQGQPSTIRLD